VRKSHALLALPLFGLVLALPREAHALGPLGIEIAAKGGYATNPDSSSPINPLGVGLGGRAGITLLGFYGGVNVLYYLGGSQDVGPLGTLSEHFLLYGIEAGYGFTLADVLTIRPQVGVGNATFSASFSGNSASTSASNLYLEPGVTGLIALGQWFVGADANLLVIPGVNSVSTSANASTSSSTYSSFTVHGQVGIRF
jgi:hypothetical protein